MNVPNPHATVMQHVKTPKDLTFASVKKAGEEMEHFVKVFSRKNVNSYKK